MDIIKDITDDLCHLDSETLGKIYRYVRCKISGQDNWPKNTAEIELTALRQQKKELVEMLEDALLYTVNKGGTEMGWKEAVKKWCGDCELRADCIAPNGKPCDLKPAYDEALAPTPPLSKLLKTKDTDPEIAAVVSKHFVELLPAPPPPVKPCLDCWDTRSKALIQQNKELVEKAYHLLSEHGFCGHHMGSDKEPKGTCAWKQMNEHGRGSYEGYEDDPVCSFENCPMVKQFTQAEALIKKYKGE